jgi:hypothetical protein
MTKYLQYYNFPNLAGCLQLSSTSPKLYFTSDLSLLIKIKRARFGFMGMKVHEGYCIHKHTVDEHKVHAPDH